MAKQRSVPGTSGEKPMPITELARLYTMVAAHKTHTGLDMPSKEFDRLVREKAKELRTFDIEAIARIRRRVEKDVTKIEQDFKFSTSKK